MGSVKFLIFMSISLKLVAAVDESLVDYYEKLINEYHKNASVYEFPEKNPDLFINPSNQHVEEVGTFDFIIIGAGSTGSAIANRLSEISSWRILLLEAGGEEDDFNEIPGQSGALPGSRMNWGYLSTPQKSCCLAMRNHQCIQTRGKVLGGSSSINAVMYVRGNEKDFDNWVKLGNDGWSYEELLPYFKKSENSQIYHDKYHGNEGPMNVEYPEPPPPLLQTFFDANEELGLRKLDYNGENQMGYGRTQFNIKHGKRVSGGNSYITPVRHRKNLKVFIHSHVTKILIEGGDDLQAYGVEFVKNGIKHKAFASKEVILSAGAINSPQVLKLSGIGPKGELERLNIPVVHDLPAVGRYLEDHPLFRGLSFRTNFTNEAKTLRQKIEDYLEGKGIFTAGMPAFGVSYIETKQEKTQIPDVELMFISPNAVNSFARSHFNFDDTTIEHNIKKLNELTDLYVYLVLLHPKSQGEVRLKSNDPRDFPDIDINYFSDDENHDLDTYYNATQFVLNLMNTKAFQKIGAVHYAPNPICDHLEKYSRKYWYCMIRSYTSTTYHPCCTTKMGKSKQYSVVDNKLNVHGIKGLRIADAGVMPSHISGHTNTACFMIGEKVSDLIKKAYEQS